MRRKSISRLNKSRFCEGSMNDRVSAIPPVHFLQSDNDHPVPVSFLTNTTSTFSSSSSSTVDAPKKGLLGQVWSGMRDKLGLKKDTTDDEKEIKTDKHMSTMSDPLPFFAHLEASAAPPSSRTRSKDVAQQPQGMYRSKEDVLANYTQLVEQGFFKAHAIQSSRMPGPGPPPRDPPPPIPHVHAHPRRPSSSHTKSNSTGTTTMPLNRLNSPPPNWPLPSKSTPKPTRTAMTVASPASVSSRGTKRMADDHDTDTRTTQEGRPQQKKLRKIKSSASGVFNPKKASRRKVSGSIRRSISAHHAPTPTLDTGAVLATKSSNASLRADPLGVVVPNAKKTGLGAGAKFTYGQDRENGAPWRGLRLR